MEYSDLGGRNQIGMRNMKYYSYFIGDGVVQTALDSMSRRILDTYSTEFQLGVLKNNNRRSLGLF
jgi:hypothetical protein